MEGKIVFIMGVTGSGKGTVIENLRKLNDDRFEFPLSYKTRKIRKTEKDGVDAHFISKEKFFEAIEHKEFLEYALVHETEYYGTKYSEIQKGLDEGKIVIKEIDMNGLEDLKEQRPELDYTTIFLNVSVTTLRDRINKREAMSVEELDRRIVSASEEEQKANNLCDFMIDASYSPEEVLEEVLNIINHK